MGSTPWVIAIYVNNFNSLIDDDRLNPSPSTRSLCVPLTVISPGLCRKVTWGKKIKIRIFLSLKYSQLNDPQVFLSK